MRELKFRAWDKKKKKWIWSYPEPFWIIGETTVFDMLKQYSIEDFDDIEVMQYTGLKDKNGKEIFEGDIIKNTIYKKQFIVNKNKSKNYYRNQKYHSIAIVEWSNHWASFNFTKYSEWGEFEIIGNIYENPELLKENKNG